MPLADYHDMVKAFPPNRANHKLRIGVLPRRAWRNDRLPDVQQPGLTRKSFAIDLIPVPDHMPRALFLPHPSISCRAVHSAVGCSVTLKCTSRRRRWLSTTSTKRTRKVAVGTVKKSDRPQDRERLPALCDRGGERSARSRVEAECAQ